MISVTDQARQYARDHQQQFMQELFEMLRIPSLSADPAHASDIQRMAEWLRDHLTAIGATNVQIIETAGLPVVYGEYMGAGPDAPTVLIYSHYDVVPASLEDGWDTDPFEPVLRDGRLYARGVADDKGQMFTHFKALEAYLKTAGSAPVNIKFFADGEEEIASPHFADILRENLELLRADLCLISDTSMPSIDEPMILHSLRGMTYFEIHVDGPSADLHSGTWGGTVHNPALALAEIISKLHNPDHSIAVPGFYDDVVPLTDAERAMLEMTAISDETAKAMTGMPAVWGEAAYTIRERVSARPTMEVHGLGSGWTGPGPKTVLPAKAMAKLSCRLVGNQNPKDIFDRIKAYIESIAPPTVSVRVELLTSGDPALISHELPELQAAVRAYEKGWGATPIFVRGGGSIPAVAELYNQMKIPVVMMGYCLDDDGFHGPNEGMSVEMIQRGIETTIVYFDEVARSHS